MEALRALQNTTTEIGTEGCDHAFQNILLNACSSRTITGLTTKNGGSYKGILLYFANVVLSMLNRNFKKSKM